MDIPQLLYNWIEQKVSMKINEAYQNKEPPTKIDILTRLYTNVNLLNNHACLQESQFEPNQYIIYYIRKLRKIAQANTSQKNQNRRNSSGGRHDIVTPEKIKSAIESSVDVSCKYVLSELTNNFTNDPHIMRIFSSSFKKSYESLLDQIWNCQEDPPTSKNQSGASSSSNMLQSFVSSIAQNVSSGSDYPDQNQKVLNIINLTFQIIFMLSFENITSEEQRNVIEKFISMGSSFLAGKEADYFMQREAIKFKEICKIEKETLGLGMTDSMHSGYADLGEECGMESPAQIFTNDVSVADEACNSSFGIISRRDSHDPSVTQSPRPRSRPVLTKNRTKDTIPKQLEQTTTTIGDQTMTESAATTTMRNNNQLSDNSNDPTPKSSPKNENNKNSRSNLKLSLTESKVKNTEICKQKSIPQREEFSSFEHEGGSQFSNYSGDTADKIQSLTDSRSTPVYIVTPADDIISMNDHSEISSLNANLEQNLNFGRQKSNESENIFCVTPDNQKLPCSSADLAGMASLPREISSKTLVPGSQGSFSHQMQPQMQFHHQNKFNQFNNNNDNYTGLNFKLDTNIASIVRNASYAQNLTESAFQVTSEYNQNDYIYANELMQNRQRNSQITKKRPTIKEIIDDVTTRRIELENELVDAMSRCSSLTKSELMENIKDSKDKVERLTRILTIAGFAAVSVGMIVLGNKN